MAVGGRRSASLGFSFSFSSSSFFFLEVKSSQLSILAGRSSVTSQTVPLVASLRTISPRLTRNARLVASPPSSWGSASCDPHCCATAPCPPDHAPNTQGPRRTGRTAVPELVATVVTSPESRSTLSSDSGVPTSTASKAGPACWRTLSAGTEAVAPSRTLSTPESESRVTTRSPTVVTSLT